MIMVYFYIIRSSKESITSHPPPPPPPHSFSTNLMATSTMSSGIPLTLTVMTTGQQFFWGHPSTPLDMTQHPRRGEINYYFIAQL